MKRSILTIIMAVLAMAGFAQYTVENLPVSTQFIDSLDYNAVCNPDDVLTTAEVDSLNQMLWSMRENQGVQGLVVAIKASDPDDPYEFAMQVGRKYGVGGKQSLGFVVLVTTEQRGYQIITGDGMEKFLTDAQCSVIGRKAMVPEFKEGEWGRGLIAGVTLIKGIVSGEVELNGTGNDSEGGDDDLGSGLLILFAPIAGVAGIAYYNNRKSRECPKCKKHNYGMKLRTVTPVEGKGKAVQVVDKYVCPDCKHTHEHRYLSTTNRFYTGTFNGKGRRRWGEVIAASAAGISAGSGWHSSGSHSSGPTFHSTFGGGSFSGGGAGGRF